MLTIRKIEAAKPQDKAYKLSDQAGLYLYVAPTGLKSWRANYREAGKQKTKTYGRYPAMSLAQAREAHASFKVEPETQAIETFEEIARAWLKIKLPQLSNHKHQIQVANTLERYAYPKIGKLPIDQIKRAQLVDVVRSVQEQGIIETAHRVAGRVTAVFDYAQDLGIIETHGAAGLVRVLRPRTVKKPMASIDINEAGRLFAAIDTYEETVTRLGLMLLAHTFVRNGELRGMRWSEIVEDGAIWVIPAERMKARIPHVVPLSTQTQAILRELSLITGERDLVLESPIRHGHSLSENTFLFALYRLGYRGKMTAHGFRALASTVLNENNFGQDVIERQLAHRETNAVRAAYNRADYLEQRREMMQWYSDWIDQQREAHQGASG